MNARVRNPDEGRGPQASIRFNSIEYLEAWRERKEWPAIHNAMTDFALTNMAGTALLELGCAFGLLGARIALEADCDVKAFGVDADMRTISLASAAKVPIRIHHLAVTRETLPVLRAYIEVEKVTSLVARRVLPELWGEDLEGGAAFADMLAEAGVREVLLEGRVASERATNPLRSIDEEVGLLARNFREVTRAKALSYLVLR